MAAITLASTWSPNPTCLQAKDLWIWDWVGANDDAYTVLGGPSQTSEDCFPTTWAPTLTYVGGPCPQEYTSACRNGANNPVTTCCPRQYDMSCNTSPSADHGSYFHCVTAVTADFPATVTHTYFPLSTTNILTMKVEAGQHVFALGIAYQTPTMTSAEITPAQTKFPTGSLAVTSDTSRNSGIGSISPNTSASASHSSTTANIMNERSLSSSSSSMLSSSIAVAAGTSGLKSSSTSQQPPSGSSSAALIVAAATAHGSEVSTGAKIGISIGSVLGMGLMTLVAWWWVLRRRQRLREQRAGWRGFRRKAGSRRSVLSVQSFFGDAWPPNMAERRYHTGAAGTTSGQPMAEMAGETTGRRSPSAAAVRQFPRAAASALRLKSTSPGREDAIGSDMSATGAVPALPEMPAPTHVCQPRWPLLQRHRHQRQANSPAPPTTTAMTASRGAMPQMAPAASTEQHPHEWGDPPAYQSPSGWPSETVEGQQHGQASHDAFDDNKAAWSSVARGEKEDYSHYHGDEKKQEARSATAAQGQAELPERAELPGWTPVVVAAAMARSPIMPVSPTGQRRMGSVDNWLWGRIGERAGEARASSVHCTDRRGGGT